MNNMNNKAASAASGEMLTFFGSFGACNDHINVNKKNNVKLLGPCTLKS